MHTNKGKDGFWGCGKQHFLPSIVEKVSYLESIKLICILLLRHYAKVFMFPLL